MSIEALDWLQDFDIQNWKLRKQARQQSKDDGNGKIELFNTCIKIHNYIAGDCCYLERRLTKIGRTGKIEWENYVIDESKKEMIISGGINVSKLLDWMTLDREDVYESSNEYDKYKKIEFKLPLKPRNDKQVRAIDFLLSRNGFEDLSDSHQKILAMKTGAGKTFCCLKALSIINQRACIIINQEGLINQWINKILEYSSIQDQEIYLIKGTDTVRYLENNGVPEGIKIFIGSHRTLAKIALEDPNRLKKLFKLMRIGIKVYDESHKEQKAVNLIDWFSNTKDTWYLTATPGRSDPQEEEIFKFCYATTPRYGESDRYKDPYHNVWLINYDSHPEKADLKKFRSFYGFNFNAYVDYCFDKGWDKLKEPLFRILDKVIKKRGKIAILISKNDIIEQMRDILQDRYENTKIGIYTTLIKDKKEREKELDSKIILSTEKSLGTGMDIKDLRFMLMFIPVKSVVVVEQIIGRLREIPDKEVYFIDFCDFGVDACIRQRRRRNEIYEMKAKEIRTIEFRNESEKEMSEFRETYTRSRYY